MNKKELLKSIKKLRYYNDAQLKRDTIVEEVTNNLIKQGATKNMIHIKNNVLTCDNCNQFVMLPVAIDTTTKNMQVRSKDIVIDGHYFISLKNIEVLDNNTLKTKSGIIEILEAEVIKWQ